MRVTVCELNNEPEQLEHDWDLLVDHVRRQGSDLVLLPEMPFYPWLAWMRAVEPALWDAAVKSHDAWIERLDELAPAIVVSTRPIVDAGKRYNEGFVYDAEGYRAAHRKYYLPDEDGFWEATWYERGDAMFTLIDSDTTRIGFLICTELWFNEKARAYGREGAHLIVTPRATEKATVEKWLMGGRVAAVVSGAYCLSSNPVTPEGHRVQLGGQGWIIDPDGKVLGLTSHEQPFVTVNIDLSEAERAKLTYPRYVRE